jgi:hypothetical protein
MNTPSTTGPLPSRGRVFLLLGLGMSILAVLAYVGQVTLYRLTMPWYLPIGTTLGVVLLVVSLWQRRTIVRLLAFVLLLLLAGAEWMFLLGTPLPPYSGPIAVGQTIPAFTTSRSDGKSFTQHDLQGDQGDKDSVLVFFRGHW